MRFHLAANEEDRLHIMKEMNQKFLERADQNDKVGSFPFKNIAELKETGYTSLTLPAEYGGKDLSLYELVRMQECIAEGDGATALSIGWHMGIVKNLFEKKNWAPKQLEFLGEKVSRGSLINSAATEPQTGSPTRGGKPHTNAEKKRDSWIINGRKSFTTMSLMLDYILVSASIKGSDQIGNFLIPRTTKGVTIEETWDSIAMRASGSHDLVLENVELTLDSLVEYFTPGKKGANGWLLHIPACYLGIAQAAQSYVIQFAKQYSPSSIEGTIVDLPNVQQKIGEIELLLMKSRYFLYSVARKWDESDAESRAEMSPQLGAVKHEVTNNAYKIVDIAMRIAGARSLSATNPLQRYYRDVRAGLHNPPMDDMTIQLLAKYAIAKTKE
ncbi:acyl-CoA dehydrogenase family protein [Cytobacillus purgationiresistens]|uniref:Alkylation response protein AidB-like acyl-CoA dehydrogenase n=1 Tax=Cytobacillus purgationiresistens TaxID=863449 RepID=A0ABU0ABH2_9BACI|nr:acyl-CoA dehydrogenase family protein [Cytobacillus purgationiresistens]MDQ0268380.1 alkylation response protein AidB-like acyl-CoA dehydrogenase [Cytobacillus purgationiresistens]